MAIPHGVISTSEGPVDPTQEAVEVIEVVEEELPEAVEEE